MTSQPQGREEATRKLAELIEPIEFAMLTTAGPGGQLHSRPMVTQEVAFDGDLWFFTSLQSHKVHEVEQDRHVNVSYVDPAANRYVSVSGMASVVRDRQKAEQLWSPLYQAWFPHGLEDPDLVLLKVHVDGAEYWDTPSSRMVQLTGFLKAAVTGRRYEPGEHGTLDMGGVEGAGL